MAKWAYLAAFVLAVAGLWSPAWAGSFEDESGFYQDGGANDDVGDGAVYTTGWGGAYQQADGRLPAGLNSSQLLALQAAHPEMFPAGSMNRADLLNYYRVDQQLGGRAISTVLPAGLTDSQLLSLNQAHPEQFPRGNMTSAELTSFYRLNQAVRVQREVGTLPAGLTRGELSYLYRASPESFPEGRMTQAQLVQYYNLVQGQYSAAYLTFRRDIALPRGLTGSELMRYYTGNPYAFPSRHMSQSEVEDYYRQNQARFYPGATNASQLTGQGTGAIGGAALTGMGVANPVTTALVNAAAGNRNVISRNVNATEISGYASQLASGALAGGPSAGGGLTSSALAAGTSVGGNLAAGAGSAVRRFTNLSPLGLSQEQIARNGQNQLRALLSLLSR